jgi:hypothetical protein
VIETIKTKLRALSPRANYTLNINQFCVFIYVFIFRDVVFSSLLEFRTIHKAQKPSDSRHEWVLYNFDVDIYAFIEPLTRHMPFYKSAISEQTISFKPVEHYKGHLIQLRAVTRKAPFPQ